jgi:uncharacterized oxidoreductase
VASVDPAVAQELAQDALVRWGASAEVAACVAGHLVGAELAGHRSHGLVQLPRYCKWITDGTYDASAEPSVIECDGAVTTIDAMGGFGYPALELAVDRAASSAAQTGIGAAFVVRCGHAGRAGAWAERGVTKGTATLVMLASAEPPFVLTAGAHAAPALSTNPIAIGVPSEGPPFVLDMATSAIAEGKALIALRNGGRVPEGALIDRDGVASTDPSDLYAGGALLPAGGYKGFGLAALIEALVLSLSGAHTLDPPCGALVLCLRPTLSPPDLVKGSVERLRARIRNSGIRSSVLAPGELEARNRQASTLEIDDDILGIMRPSADPEKPPAAVG